MLRFNRNYFVLAALLFFIEVLIALFVRDQFVRPYLGDVLVVVLVYSFLKSFIDLPVVGAVIFVLIFSFTIEFLQYLNIVARLGLQKSNLARTVLGTSFSWNDMLAYVAGAALIVVVEILILKKNGNKKIQQSD